MSDPAYHAEDGEVPRSSGGAAARGAMLIALALAIGLLLIMFALDDPQTEVTAAGTDSVESGEVVDGDGTDDGAGTETDATTDPSVEAVDPIDDAGVTPATIPPLTEETEVEDAPVEGVELPANEVNVLVANGTGGAGVAGGVADVLIADGYTTAVSNAPSTDLGVVYYKPGYSANAKLIAEALGAAPDAVQAAPDSIGVASDAIADGRVDAANVVVIIGTQRVVPVS